MRVKLLLLSILSTMVLATGCSDEKAVNRDTPKNAKAGYLSFAADIPTTGVMARSEEDPGDPSESELHTMYAVTFNAANKVVTYEGAATAYTQLTSSQQPPQLETPDVFKVTSEAKRLLIIANPGTKLMSVLTSLTSGTSFEEFNAAIENIDEAEIVDATNGFTMINVGETVADDRQTDADNGRLCLTPIPATKIKIVGDGNQQYAREDDAKAAAAGDRLNVRIERLSAKIFTKSANPVVTLNPDGTPNSDATLSVEGWTVDVRNTKLYPWAQRVQLASSPTNGNFYTNNFYTIDPNYGKLNPDGTTDTDTDGLVYYGRDATTLRPEAPFSALNTTGNLIYVVENTMRAGEQRWMCATRLIVKAKYWPYAGGSGDWFRFNETVYKTFDDMHDAYIEAETGNVKPNFRLACDKFYTVLRAYANANSIASFTATDFKTITTAMLADTKFDGLGGEVTRVEDCIRWYEDGINYYYYEIRHDDSVTEQSGFAKYGVVRNNWYNLTIASVSGWGTPWYPSVDPNDPDPDGPNPPDPIDGQEGWLGVEIEVAPWVRWDKDVPL